MVILNDFIPSIQKQEPGGIVLNASRHVTVLAKGVRNSKSPNTSSHVSLYIV